MARWNRFAGACPERRRGWRRWATALAAAFSLAAAPALARDHHHHHHRWHRDRIDGGDVLAGAAIIGVIAAIASAKKRERQAQAPAPLPDDRQGYAHDGAERSVGLDRAADICADEVERGPDRVDSVDTVTRDGEGWAVSGALANGASFNCRIGNDGRVQSVGGSGVAPAQRVGAYADDAPGAQDGDPAVDDRPEWPGDGAQPQPRDDGRYSTSDAPDFGD